MKSIHWVKITVINLLLIIIIMLPFLPGPPNKIVIGLSAFGQFAGFFGLILIPIGMAWTLFEFNKSRTKVVQKSNWRPAFYSAIIATIIVTAICVLLAIAVMTAGEKIIGISALLLIAVLLLFVIREIKKLRHPAFTFNPIPVYLITIPVVAFLTTTFIVKPVSNSARDLAIKRSDILIASVESFKNKQGYYPESITELERHSKIKIPSPAIMGILNYRYNKINGHYSISFSQWLEWGSLEQIVLYDKYYLRNNLTGKYAKYDYSFDLCRVKGAFAMHETKYDNWQYYLVD